MKFIQIKGVGVLASGIVNKLGI